MPGLVPAEWWGPWFRGLPWLRMAPAPRGYESLPAPWPEAPTPARRQRGVSELRSGGVHPNRPAATWGLPLITRATKLEISASHHDRDAEDQSLRRQT